MKPESNRSTTVCRHLCPRDLCPVSQSRDGISFSSHSLPRFVSAVPDRGLGSVSYEKGSPKSRTLPNSCTVKNTGSDYQFFTFCHLIRTSIYR